MSDVGDTPTTRQTERIMQQIREHLKQEDPPQENHHYNRVYEIIHRELRQLVQVARLKAADQILGAIPTTWLDPLLSGRKKVITAGPSCDEREIEKLLRAIRDRASAIKGAP